MKVEVGSIMAWKTPTPGFTVVFEVGVIYEDWLIPQDGSLVGFYAYRDTEQVLDKEIYSMFYTKDCSFAGGDLLRLYEGTKSI